MKKTVYILLFVILTFLMASTVYAASFTVNDLEFGSSNIASGQDVSQTLHIVNDGNESLVLGVFSYMPSTYNVRLSQSIISIDVGSSIYTYDTAFWKK
jgi:uncharacterized protein (DUF58 family)